MNLIRGFELQLVWHLFPPGGRILEIGAGSGYQASRIKEQGFQVEAIEVNLHSKKIFDVKKYDGKTIPFPDHYFDIVFSSNVLEHIEGVEDFQEEIKRVLKPNGCGIHILPTATWRFWSWLTHCANWFKIIYKLAFGLVKTKDSLNSDPEMVMKTKKAMKQLGLLGLVREKLLIAPHGVRGNAFTEAYYFSRYFWIPFFKRTGWKLISYYPSHLFYTDSITFGIYLKLKYRQILSYILGSACIVYIVKK
ncbi:MAG: class I SAM-dependent methyltransferase [Nitrospina sp.]|nr:class I SAM-dependent methyltransferase [Nitrospina sp.]